MAWGDPGVSKKLRLSNGSVSISGQGGMPVTNPVQQVGILRALRMLVAGTPTYTPGTGSIARDVLGPWNLLSLVTLSPNQQSPIVQLSGYGLYLVNMMIGREGAEVSPDTALVSETSSDPLSDVYTGSQTSGTATYRFPLTIPVAQRIRSIGGDVGLWPLQNPAVQLQASVTPNVQGSASPYNIFSTTGGASPYLVTGNATVTLASPTYELIRELWQVPDSQQDYPPFELVSTWVEEAPQGANVNGATAFTWQATPLSGILARVGVYIFDGGTSQGVAASSLTASNALQLTYDADTPKFSESAAAALARQKNEYGAALPQGFFAWDLLGSDLTLQDTLNTNVVGNIKVKASLNVALGSSGSFVKIIRQIISPLEVK